MEISSFLKMWMDVWNEAEKKGLKMPEEAVAFQKKEAGNDEVMKEIIKFLPKRDFLSEDEKTTADSLEKIGSQKNLMAILEKGQTEKESISFLEERKKKIAANMEVVGERIQESRQGKAEEVFGWNSLKELQKCRRRWLEQEWKKWEKHCFYRYLQQMVQKEKFCGCCGNGRKKRILLKHRSRFPFPLGRCGKAPM